MKVHKTTSDKVKLAVGVACFAVIVIVSLAVRLSNPALTETQLLINFLPVWLAIAVTGVIGVWLIGK